MSAGGAGEGWADSRGNARARRGEKRRRWTYALAVGSACAAVGLKLLLGDYLSAPYLLPLAAVMVSASTGGLGPGIVATALSAVLVYLALFDPVFTIFLEHPTDLIGLLVFLAVGLSMSVIADRRRNAELRASRQAEKLQDALTAQAESETRFRALIERSSDVTMVVDEEGKFTFVSPAFHALIGTRPEEVLGRSAFDFNHPDDAPRAMEALAAVTRDPASTRHVRVRVRRADGSWALLDASVTNMLAVPAVRGIVVNNRDITERAEAEQVIRDREARLRAYFDSPSLGIAVTSPDKGLLEVNDRFCSMLGYTRDELDRLTWLELTHPEDRAAEVAEFDRVVAGEIDRYSRDKRVIRKDGSILWVGLSVSCVRRRDGSIDYTVAILQDITERKLAERELRETQGWLLQSQEIARIGSYVFDIPGDRWSSSVTLEAIFGIDASYPRKASDWLQVVHPEDRESMGLYLADLLARGSRFEREYRVVNQRSGETLWVHGLGELERGPGGEPIRLVGTIQDITRRRMADLEREGLQAKLALAQRLAAMGTLVSGIAHEINNPLAAIVAGEGVALEEARGLLGRFGDPAPLDREAGRRRLEVIVEALADATEGSHRVSRIVKDLAAFANPDPKRTLLRLSDVVATAIRWMPKALAQGVDIRVEDGKPPPVLASAGQIEQVVVNLVTNAAKATAPGRRGDIVIRTGPGGPGMAHIEVVDDGVGVAPEIRDRIFEPFFTTRRVGTGRGSGLGLAICHAIVTDHGGTITVESEVGKGSTFRVELPAAPTEA